MSFNPYLEIIFASVIWGTAGIFVKSIGLPVTTMTFFRVLVPAAILFIYYLLKGKNLFKHANKTILFISLLTVLRLFLWYFGFLHTSIGNGVIILYTWPVFAVLLSPIILKEKLTGQKILLTLLAFVGIVIVFANKEFSLTNGDFIGMLAMLGSAMLSAICTLMFKKQLNHYSKSETIFYQNIVGVFVFLPFFLINRPFPTLTQSAISTLYSVMIGFLAFLLWFSALKKVKASTAALLSYFEVISAIILGVIFLKEGITLNMIIGGGIILTVSYFARKSEPELVAE